MRQRTRSAQGRLATHRSHRLRGSQYQDAGDDAPQPPSWITRSSVAQSRSITSPIMILYHFTCEEHLPSILRERLWKGDVVTSLNSVRVNSDGLNAVNLTELSECTMPGGRTLYTLGPKRLSDEECRMLGFPPGARSGQAGRSDQGQNPFGGSPAQARHSVSAEALRAACAGGASRRQRWRESVAGRMVVLRDDTARRLPGDSVARQDADRGGIDADRYRRRLITQAEEGRWTFRTHRASAMAEPIQSDRTAYHHPCRRSPQLAPGTSKVRRRSQMSRVHPRLPSIRFRDRRAMCRAAHRYSLRMWSACT